LLANPALALRWTIPHFAVALPETQAMSKQLIMSATISVTAMLAFILAGGPAMASDTGLGMTPLHMMIAACAPPSVNELMPVIQPGLL
jgi:hypothetical protein